MNKKSKNKKTKNRSVDKIKQNDYNTGNYEYNHYGQKMNLNEQSDNHFVDNFFEAHEKKQIKETIYSLFEQSEFYEKYKYNKRIERNKIMDLFYYFFKHPDLTKYSLTQQFMEICNFMNFDFTYVFNNLQINDKEKIIIELDNDYGYISKNNKLKKLF